MNLPQPIAPPLDLATRPAWANRLPRYETLRYTQTLLLTGVLVLLAGYLAVRAADTPGALLQAARKRTGV